MSNLDLRCALGLPPTVFVHFAQWRDFDPLSARAPMLPASLVSARPKRQREFLLGRYCAASALIDAGHQGAIALPIGGDRLPGWPPGWLGSISHAGSGAVAAVARRTSCGVLGIDMECLMTESVATEVRHLVAHRDELALVSSLGADAGLTLLFSAKEALYKALYPQVRRFFDFTAARAVTLGDHLVLRLMVSWSRSWPAGTLVPVRFVFHDAHVFTAVQASDRNGTS